MTLSPTIRAGSIVTISLLVFAATFFGNQPQAEAQNLARDIVCRIFTSLNEVHEATPISFPPFRPGCSDRGGLVVKKIVQGGTATPENFQIHVKSNGTDIPGSPAAGASVGRGYGNLPPGGYVVSESGGPSGYTATFSGDCNASGNVLVNAGQLSNCTITNTFTGGGPTPPAQCSDGQDNDGDSFSDANDPNCHTDGNPTNTASYDPNKNDESGSLPACWNGLDDDGDGLKDFPNDPGCSSAIDTDESNGGTSPLPQCSNGTDDDGDNLIDSADPGCHTDFDVNNPNSYDPNGTSEARTSACSDGVDNDSDSLTDGNDPGCENAADDNESNGGGTPTPPSGGGGGGGGGGSAIATQVAPGLVLGTTTAPYVAPHESCDQYLHEFIRSGRANNPEQVRRLQYVLREFERMNVEMTGVYDEATLAAVHAFQEKYASEILIPWGIEESTGFVYLTTRKKVNEIYCRGTNQFPLTPAEQRVVDRARAENTGTPLPSTSTSRPSTQNQSAGAVGAQTNEEPSEESMEEQKPLWQRVLDALMGERSE